jgi:hypothetical protein
LGKLPNPLLLLEIKTKTKVAASKQKSFSLSSFGYSRQTLIMVLSLLMVTFLIFSGNLNNEILIGWDDGVYLEDPFVQNLNGESIAHYFSSYYLGMYQPIGVLTYAINYAFHAESAFGYQLVNLLLHLLNTFLVFLFVRRLHGKEIFALAIAALFALHPMHVEAVSWIATRSNAVYSAFFLLAGIQYLKYLESGNKFRWIFYTGLLFILALFSKSMAVSFPFVMLLLDYFKGRKFTKQVWIEKVPFFFLSLIFGIVTVKAAQSFGHIETLTQDYSFLDRILLITGSLFFYLWKLIIPVKLSAIYTFPELVNGLLPWLYYVSLPVLTGIIIWIWKSKTIKRELIFGFGFFLVTIAPVLPFFWSRIFIVAERYTYIPYLGLFFVMVLLFDNYLKSKLAKKIFPASWGWGIAAVWMLFLMGATYYRTAVWSNTTSLLNDVIQKENSDHDVAAAHFYRGNLYDQEKQYERAFDHYSEAIRLNSAYVLAYNNRGIILGTMGRNIEAIEDFNHVLKLKPDYAEGWYNRGIAFYQLGRKQEACNDWLKASRLGSAPAKQVRRQYCQ